MDLAPISIPELGDTHRAVNGTASFTVPTLDPSTVRIERLEPEIEFEADADSAETIIENARREAVRIVTEAEENRAVIEAAALEKARLQAAAETEAEIEKRVSDRQSQLAETLEKLAGLSNEIVGHVESDLVELAIQIAKKIVRREVTIDREIALTLVRVSLSKLNQRTAAEVHLNPDDLAYINSRQDAIDFRGALTLVEDPSVSLGGCLVHTDTGEVDARIESQFDEIAFGLLS